MTALWFLVAAAAGASVRFASNRAAEARGFPGWWATLGVNVVGSFGLGSLAGSDVGETAFVVLGTGFFGALTTFSTFAVDAAIGRRRDGLVVVGLSLAGGLSAAAVGWTLTA